MTTSKYIYSFLDINMATLRFWGDKPQELLDILHFDTPVGWYVFEGFHAEALAPSFEIVDENGEVLPEFEALANAAIKNTTDIYLKARSESNKLYSVLGMFEFNGEDETLYFITDSHITELEIKPGTKEITTFSFIPPNENSSAISKVINVEGLELENLRLLGDYDRRIGKFRCKYESIIDNLLGLSILDQQLVLLIIRVGSGIRYIVVPASYISSSAARKELEDFLENLGMNSLLVVPANSSKDDKFEFKLDFGEGTPPINWAESRSNLLRGIGVRLGVPEEVFNGAEIGMRSAETNRTRFLNSLSREQKDMENDLIWCIEKHYDIEFPESRKIKWNPFAKPDEKTQVEVFKLSMDAMTAALSINKKAGIPLEWIKESLNLDYKIDQSLIAEFEQSKEIMQQGLNQGVEKDDTNPSDEEGDSPEDQELQSES